MNSKIPEQILGLITKINEKNPYYLVVGLIVVILIVDYFCVMQFQLNTVGSLGSRIATLSQELETTETNIQRMSQYQIEVERLREKLERMSGKIRTREEVPLLLENISRIANKHAVQIEQIMPDKTEGEPILQNSDGEYFSIPVSIEARAGYHDFGRFLNELERDGDFFRVPEFVIAASSDDPMRHAIKLMINAIVFEKAQ